MMGSTLNDLVAYKEKYNYRNGEHNRDGHSHNLSSNFGVYGPDRRHRNHRPVAAKEEPLSDDAPVGRHAMIPDGGDPKS